MCDDGTRSGMAESPRVSVRVREPLYEDMQAVLDDDPELNQSQLVREGIRLAVTRRRSGLDGSDAELAAVLDRLENAAADMERQASRLQRLPLK